MASLIQKSITRGLKCQMEIIVLLVITINPRANLKKLDFIIRNFSLAVILNSYRSMMSMHIFRILALVLILEEYAIIIQIDV